MCLYVEDSGKEYQYSFLFERLFEEICLEDMYTIQSAGCKNNIYQLLEQYNENLQTKGIDYGLIFCIVDGDFDVILNRIHDYDNIVYLNKCDIEACIFEEKAIRMANRKKFQLTKKQEEKFFNYQFWYDEHIGNLIKLFLLFAVASKLRDGRDRSAVGKYLDMNTGKLKFEQYEALKQHLLDTYEDIDINAEISYIKQQCVSTKKKLDDIVSGKFLISCFLKSLEALYKKQYGKGPVGIKEDVYKTDLFSYCDWEPFE